MSNPFSKKLLPSLAIGYTTDLAGSVGYPGSGEYAEAPAVSGQRAIGNASVIGVMANRQFVKLGPGGMRAPRKSE
jgi:hypothetical protein